MTEAAAADTEWIAVDWGTTNLRAWAMAGDRPLATTTAPAGMGGLARDAFEPALVGVIGDWLAAGRTTPVIACGMVGARQGWVEAPYVMVPAAPLDIGSMRRVEAADPRIAVTIVHGLAQADPPDVMRGEETQIAGLAAREPGFDGIACLPGTHAKWAVIRDRRIERFRSFMTGELFAALRAHTVLRHSAGDASPASGTAFAQAVALAAADPAGLAAHLFAIRAAGLLAPMSAQEAHARLSGLLIGAEVAAMRASWEGGPVAIIGDGAVAGLYARAIDLLGGTSRMMEAEATTLAGLVAARRLIVEGDAR